MWNPQLWRKIRKFFMAIVRLWTKKNLKLNNYKNMKQFLESPYEIAWRFVPFFRLNTRALLVDLTSLGKKIKDLIWCYSSSPVSRSADYVATQDLSKFDFQPFLEVILPIFYKKLNCGLFCQLYCLKFFVCIKGILKKRRNNFKQI